VVYEPTGAYHGAFERACAGHLPLCKVNPLQARRFAQARGTRAKSDSVYAWMLALMGAAFALEPDLPMSEKQRELKELQVQPGPRAPSTPCTPSPVSARSLLLRS